MDLVQGEVGRVIPLTWDNNENISSYTLTGLIETSPGINYTVRQIIGALNPTGSSAFSWTLAEQDTTYAGIFTVQFIATLGAVVLKTVPSLMKVYRSPEWV
jgi:hypothetical protein